jgi:hypothetical protein
MVLAWRRESTLFLKGFCRRVKFQSDNESCNEDIFVHQRQGMTELMGQQNKTVQLLTPN